MQWASPASTIWAASSAAQRTTSSSAAAPSAALHKNGICDRNVLSKAEENSLLLCVGQGGYEGDALADTQALADTLSEVGFPCHLEVWGGDVSHDWYWWGKEFGMFAERLFG